MANMNFGVNILPKANNTYTLGNSDYKWNIFANTLNGISLTNIITDIQIDGTSILSNNVANIPIGTWDVLGVVKPNPDYGVGRIASDNPISNGTLWVAKATSAQIKTGNNEYKPIVPYNQHESVFYGLAKAAGDSTQSASSNAVGLYTDSAKTAIKNMLAVPKIDDNEDYDLNTTWSAKRLSTTTRIHSWISSNFTNGLELPTPTIIADQKIDEQGNLVSDSNYNTYVYALTLNTTLIIYTRNNEEFTYGQYSSSSISSSNLYSDITITNGYDYIQIMAPYFAFSCEKTTVNNNNVIILYMGFTGVTNTDYATTTTPGIVMVNGYGLWVNPSNGHISLTKASTNQIKEGTQEYYPIVPYNLKDAVFYGLAKAAGDSTQASSSNAVGTYTSQAQSAIRNMLAAAPKSSPFFTGAISLGRYRNNADQSDEANTIGFYSIAVGNNVAASGESSQAFGQDTYAVGWTAHAEGRATAAYGNTSHTEGVYTLTEEGAWASHAEGSDTIANTPCVHVGGQYNSITDLSLAPTWTANTNYAVGDIVKHEETEDDETYAYVYRCITANNDATFDYEKWITWQDVGDFAEIIGNGGYINDDEWTELRSNARALDWQGNEYLNGDLYIHCNNDSTGGTQVATIADLQNKLDLISDTSTGNPVVFNSTIGNMPLKSIKLNYLYTQSGSGDPYPPGGGKNKFDKDAVVRRDGYGIEYDGIERATETAGYTENFIPVKPSTHYTYSGSGIRLPIYYNENKEFLSRESGQDTPFTFATNAYTHYIRIQYRLSDVDMSTWQIEEGSSATTYAPYSNIRPISGISSLSCIRTGKNMAKIRGYSATTVTYNETGSLSNSYGTTLSTIGPENSVVITQSQYPNTTKKYHYTNGYFSVRTDNLVDGQNYDISFKVTNITNNPLNASLSDIVVALPTTSTLYGINVDGDVIKFTNFTYRETSPKRACFFIYNCGMSFTLSEFMITPANTSDGVYEAYNGTEVNVTFPPLGKNLLKVTANSKTEAGVTYTVNPDGTITLSGTASGYSGLTIGSVDIPSAQKITISGLSDNTTNVAWDSFNLYDADDTLVQNISGGGSAGNKTIDLSQYPTAVRMTVAIKRSSNVATSGTVKPMVEIGETASAFEPYCNTVYGGSLDLVSGVLTVEWEGKSARWGNIRTDRNQISGYYQGTINFDHDMVPATAPSDYGSKILCNINNLVRWEGTSYTPEHIYLPSTNKKVARIIGDYDPDTIVQIVAKYETPITIQLDPHSITTFKGINTIWANTNGPIEIENHIDLETIKEYADNVAGVQDIQINEMSILNNNIANIPIADTTTFGVMKIGDRLGLSNDNKIYVRRATADQIKAGTTDAAMISAQYLNNATFYGLAKAAGDTTQSSSSNAIGNYTENAKIAIQKMLGIYSAPWELINEETFTNATEADYTITTDSNGKAFELTDIRLLFELPKLSEGDVASSKGNYGQIWFYYDTNSYFIAEPGAFSRTVGESAKGCWYLIEYKDGMITMQFSRATTSSNANTICMRFNSALGGVGADNNMGMKLYGNTFKMDKIVIRGVTGNGHYKLYGKRKWTI